MTYFNLEAAVHVSNKHSSWPDHVTLPGDLQVLANLPNCQGFTTQHYHAKTFLPDCVASSPQLVAGRAEARRPFNPTRRILARLLASSAKTLCSHHISDIYYSGKASCNWVGKTELFRILILSINNT